MAIHVTLRCITRFEPRRLQGERLPNDRVPVRILEPSRDGRAPLEWLHGDVQLDIVEHAVQIGRVEPHRLVAITLTLEVNVIGLIPGLDVDRKLIVTVEAGVSDSCGRPGGRNPNRVERDSFSGVHGAENSKLALSCKHEVDVGNTGPNHGLGRGKSIHRVGVNPILTIGEIEKLKGAIVVGKDGLGRLTGGIHRLFIGVEQVNRLHQHFDLGKR